MQFDSTGQKSEMSFVSLVSASAQQQAAICHCRSLMFFFGPRLNWLGALKIDESSSRVLLCEALQRTAMVVVTYPDHQDVKCLFLGPCMLDGRRFSASEKQKENTLQLGEIWLIGIAPTGKAG